MGDLFGDTEYHELMALLRRDIAIVRDDVQGEQHRIILVAFSVLHIC